MTPNLGGASNGFWWLNRKNFESPEEARAFDHDGILQRIKEAEKALDSGLPEAAFLLAWSACEAGIRVSLAAEGVITPGITLSRLFLIRPFPMVSFPRDEYRNLNNLQKHRNAIAHGSVMNISVLNW